MDTITSKRISEQLIGQARAVSILSLAERITQLHRAASQEWAGPCPKCFGNDRFHVHEEGWFNCRQCHIKRGNVIELMQWQHGYTFPQAVEQLTNGSLPPARPQVPRQMIQSLQVSQDEWRCKTEPTLRQAQQRLWSLEGKAAQDYLLSRGIQPHVWEQYGIGYKLDVSVPGTRGQQKAPAIAIPWFAGGKLVALRYRFLEMQSYIDEKGKEHWEKQTAEAGSKFGGRLFGGQGLFGGAERFRWLLIVEGEINLMSCWQEVYEMGWDVLSIGSESSSLSPAMIKFAEEYRGVFLWTDKGEVVLRLKEELRSAIPDVVAIKSPHSMDANDLLREGLLGGFLAGNRERFARNDDDREDLLWSLYDAAMLPTGIDTESAKILHRLAAQLGRKADIYQPKLDEDRWITS